MKTPSPIIMCAHCRRPVPREGLKTVLFRVNKRYYLCQPCAEKRTPPKPVT